MAENTDSGANYMGLNPSSVTCWQVTLDKSPNFQGYN